jgi:hypothetical protein
MPRPGHKKEFGLQSEESLLSLRCHRVQSQQLLTERQVFKDEVLPGPESADHPPEEMPKQHDNGENLIGKSESSFAPRHSFCRRTTFWRDTGLETPIAVRSMGLIPVRTSFESPWQNGIAERWVGSCRRDLLDHVIAMNEAHLKRLLSEYVSYFDEDRTHLGLQKETPGRRVRAAGRGGVTALPRLGGLHHRYERVA